MSEQTLEKGNKKFPPWDLSYLKSLAELLIDISPILFSPLGAVHTFSSLVVFTAHFCPEDSCNSPVFNDDPFFLSTKVICCLKVSMSDFRVVDPGCSAFSAAKTRISRTSIRLSSLAAAELNYLVDLEAASSVSLPHYK